MSRKPLSTAARIWVLVGLTVLFVVTVHLVITRDIPPIDDSDLALPHREIDPAENPFPEFREIQLPESSRSEISEAYRQFTKEGAVDPRVVAELRSRHEVEIDRFHRYSEMTDWSQDLPLRMDTTVPFLSEWKLVAELLHLDAISAYESSHSVEAAESALALLRFGSKFSDCDGGLIYFLMGSRISLMGRQLLLRGLDEGRFDEDLLQDLARSLEKIPETGDSIKRTLRAEYQGIRSLIDDLDQGKLNLTELRETGNPNPSSRPSRPAWFRFKRNRTLLLYADFHRRLETEMDGNRKEGTRSGAIDSTRIRTEPWNTYLGGNPVGEILFSLSAPAVETVADKAYIDRAQGVLLRLRVALERYRLAHEGALPSSLDDLVPTYLDSVPLDPFDGEPIRYDPGNGVIYSVGTDFEDNGGIDPHKPGSLNGRDEIVIELAPGKEP